MSNTSKLKPLRLLAVGFAATLLVFACASTDELLSRKDTKQQDASSVPAEAPEDFMILEDVAVTGTRVDPESHTRRMRAEQEARRASAEKLARRSQMAMHMAAPVAQLMASPGYAESHDETYFAPDESGVKQVSTEPVSTFSVDVDTASYANVRRMINQGSLPPTDAVRIEEFINYFDYQYPDVSSSETPFSVTTDVSVSPWNKGRHLMRIALKGYQPQAQVSVARNLVFLIDVSGSMNYQNKLPLLKQSLKMLTNQLTQRDKVSIVVYAGASGVVLEPTDGNNHTKIIDALSRLNAGGSTNGGAGIELAYRLAAEHFIEGGVNRVLLATDGDFNVGMHNHEQLIDLIERKRDSGVTLSVLGFGDGNYNDHLTEQLADKGNGNASYIDSLNEARKVLVDEMQSNFQVIAKDVKIQVEFNPRLVHEYRLIGYENRALAREDFNNDKVDAGDIGAGHRVTALYEVTLVDSEAKYHDQARYADNQPVSADTTDDANSTELAFVKLRYKQPTAQKSNLISQAVELASIQPFAKMSEDFQFAVAVIGFGQQLKHSKFAGEYDYDWVLRVANQNKGSDDFGYRGEFVQLVRTAKLLSQQQSNQPAQGGH